MVTALAAIAEASPQPPESIVLNIFNLKREISHRFGFK
jgi:hypothetical protein